MTRPPSLVLRYRGWATVRLATEPDPPDEPTGASGFTFAFAGEPPLDRIIRTQPLDDPQMVRPGASWGWGVYVHDAFLRHSDGATVPRRELIGTRMMLHGSPKFENRSWLLTPPGWEPIVPFDLAIEPTPGSPVLRRSAPLDPDNPTRPVWQQPLERLLAQGAKDINQERETVGAATGIWDAIVPLEQRVKTLEALRAEERDSVRRHCLESRLRELRFALRNDRDRRVMVRYFVERFNVVMKGADALVPASGDLAALDPAADWLADFWLGAFDFDLLAAFFSGSLQVPFRG